MDAERSVRKNRALRVLGPSARPDVARELTHPAQGDELRPVPPPRWLGAASLALALTALGPRRASAAFSPDQQARLDAGELVVEPLEYSLGDRKFVGGVSYTVATAPIEQLSVAMRDPTRLSELLPSVEKVELLSVSKTGVGRVRVTHKLGFTRGSYTILCLFHDAGRLGRFWVDPTADNAVDDAWGYMRLTPLPGGRTLVTFALLFDLGPGMLRALFERRIQRLALEYPRRLAHAVW